MTDISIYAIYYSLGGENSPINIGLYIVTTRPGIEPGTPSMAPTT